MASAVSMKNISKFFGDFCALDDVSFKVEKGTIHALLGENGAGKSTLMNILYGLYNADKGEIYIDGGLAHIKNPSVAIKHGIGMVHQHFMLVEPLTVAQNITLGAEVTSGYGILDMKKAKEDILTIAEKYGLNVDPDAKIEDISVGMQQRVEILKILYRGADILIFDEPTAVLTPQEIVELIAIMRNLIKDNKTIIIITHKLEEIKAVSDYCTIIRRGKYIDTVNVSETNEMQLATMMVGRDVNLHVDKGQACPGEQVLSIQNLRVSDYRGLDKLKDFALTVNRGEIVGIAGIDGNGQKELVEAITCLTKVKAGEIVINGVHLENTSPRHVIENGVCTIHEDRHKRGLVLEFSVELNAVIENFQKQPYANKGILAYDKITEHTNELIKNFDIRPDNCIKLPAAALSGGNQQKLIIAREFSNDPVVLIAVQPTRGLDVGAIEYVHKALLEQRNQGKAVLLISFELDEIMDLSDRIAVLYDGSIVDIFQNDGSIDENNLGLLMAGGGKEHAKA